MHITHHLPEYVLAVLIFVGSVQLGLLAFVYPQVFATTRKLKDISQNYMKMFFEKIWIKHYLLIITLCLIIISLYILIYSFFFELLVLFPYDSDLEYICCISTYFLIISSVLICVMSILASYSTYNRLNIFYNIPEKVIFPKSFFKFKSDGDYEEYLNIIQSLIIHSFTKQNDISLAYKLIKYLQENFLLTYSDDNFNHKDILAKHLYESDSIINRPIVVLQYINQKACETKDENISFDVVGAGLKILDDYLKIRTYTSHHEIEQNIIDRIKYMMFYKIRYGFSDRDNFASLIYHFFFILSENNKDNDNFYGINSLLLNFNVNVSEVVFKMIDNNFDFSYFKAIQERFRNSGYLSPRNDLLNIQVLNCSIISYMLYKNEYELAIEYINYESPKNQIPSHIYPQIPRTINGVVRCFIEKNSVFRFNDKYDNERSYQYKWQVIILLMIKIRDYITIYNKNKINFLYDISFYEEFDSNILSQIPRHNLFYNFLSTPETIKEHINSFFANKKLLKIIGIEEQIDNSITDFSNIEKINLYEYKKWIENELLTFSEIITTKQDEILNSPISEDIKNDIRETIKYLYDDFKFHDFSMKNSNIIQETNYFYSEIEKADFLVFDDSPFRFSKRFITAEYQNIIKKLAKHTKKISDIDEIKENDLSNYIIINNFGGYEQEFTKFIDKKHINTSKLSGKVESININNQIVYSSKWLHLFHVNLPIERILLLIDKTKFNILKNKLGNIEINEDKIEQNDNLDLYITEKYKTNKKITLKVPYFTNIENLSEYIGYMVIRKE